MTTPFESAIVRVCSTDGTIVGVGFLVTDRHILTCAHVVTSALGLLHDTPDPPEADLHLDFPLLASGQVLTARVSHWQPVTDVAGLKLTSEPPPGAKPVRLVVADDLWGHSFRALGFPAGYDQGVWASGVSRSRQADGWLQIEDPKMTGYLIAPGFSGGPVWDDVLEGVVGMVVAADTSERVKAAFLIPADVLMENWPNGKRLRPDVFGDDTPEATKETSSTFQSLPPERLPSQLPLWPTSLPGTEPYYSLPQQDVQLQGVMCTLRDPKGRRIIAIDGLGGLGKTAMAVEIGRRCLQEGLFQRILGESAKQERLVGEKIEKQGSATLSFDRLLDAIARQMGRWDIPTMKPEEKQATLQYSLQHNPYLIIVDNLETAENARSLVMELQDFVDGSRVIVTSRPQLGLDFVYTLSLKGLDVVDSLVFLREEARSRNRPEILEAPDEKIWKIHEATGGAPLAMKLIVGQASALPLDVVLENLRQAKGESLYRFIYLESWGLLSIEAQKLLIYMGTVVTTCAYHELASVDIAGDEETLQEVIKETTRLSLLNPIQVADQMRYGVHQLTRHFVNSELPAIWKEQGLL